MKKIVLPLIASLFIGCANNQTDIPHLNSEILKKYEVSETSLKPLNNGYVFEKMGVAGADIYYLDKNYKLVKKVTIKNVEPLKLKVINNKIYMLGLKNSKPIVIIYDNQGKLIKNYSVGKKFDIPVDIVDDKVLLTKYNNGSYINFGKLNLKSNGSLTANRVIKFNNGYLIVGTILEKSENLFIAFIQNDKIVWAKTYDFGMDNGINNIKTEKDKIYLDVYATDYMGAETEYKIVLDKNGKIIKKSKTLEIKELPTNFRT